MTRFDYRETRSISDRFSFFFLFNFLRSFFFSFFFFGINCITNENLIDTVVEYRSLVYFPFSFLNKIRSNNTKRNGTKSFQFFLFVQRINQHLFLHVRFSRAYFSKNWKSFIHVTNTDTKLGCQYSGCPNNYFGQREPHFILHSPFSLSLSLLFIYLCALTS